MHSRSREQRLISKRGLSLLLDTPLDVKANDQVWVDYLELKLYDKAFP